MWLCGKVACMDPVMLLRQTGAKMSHRGIGAQPPTSVRMDVCGNRSRGDEMKGLQ